MFDLIPASRRLTRAAKVAATVLLTLATHSIVLGQTALTNGGNHPGTIAAGGIDPYTFNGTAGESITLRVGATNFVPQIELHGPGGPLVVSAPSSAPSGVNRDVLITVHLATSGLYTADVSSY